MAEKVFFLIARWALVLDYRGLRVLGGKESGRT
jgi:hypothetical protein